MEEERMTAHQMDVLTLSCLSTALGYLPPQLVPMAVRTAGAMAERSLLPGAVMDRLTRLGISCHHVVWPAVDLGHAMPSLTAHCRWALVWMEADEVHGQRWWSILHTCDTGLPGLTYLVHRDPDLCYCRGIGHDWTGHAVTVDSLPDGQPLRVG